MIDPDQNGPRETMSPRLMVQGDGAQLLMNIRIRFLFLAACIALTCSTIDSARADITVRIQLSQQTMNVAVDGIDFATWPVSTARRGYRTPVGTYKPYQLERMHYSRLYDDSPMPYSIFFRGGYAIHGTMEVQSLGRAVSHGCVRLSPDNARSLFELVQSHGAASTRIEIVE
jgi:lipoprotein-anchoring transpeptidase ErfK/SrfK